MADKTIGQLQAASQVTPTDLFVLEQSGTAKKLTGQTLENWLLTFADGHGGIQSIEKTGTSGLTDTYTITLSDATTVTLTVHNGKGISSVTTYYAVSSSGSTVPSNWSTTRQSMTATNRYLWSYQRIAFNDNTNTDTAKTVIGVYGDKGDKGDTGNTGNGIASLAQTGRVAGEYTTYTFTMTDGTTESFEAYDGVGITGIDTYYAVSSSDSTPPSTWYQTRQNMTSTNRYLWSYQDIHLSNNTNIATPKVVIGVYGDKGDKGDKGDPGEVTQAEFDELSLIVGSNAFALDEHILVPIKYATLASDMTVTFSSPENQLYTDYVSGLIPLPVTLDGKITHNGNGYSSSRAIVFYNSAKVPIDSATQSGYNLIETTIPDGSAFFRLRRGGGSASQVLQASFNLSVAEKANYLRTLIHFEPDLYINDFDAPNIFTLEHTEISTSTGEDTYSSSSNYSATDFILLPDDIELIGTYAYTASGRARVAFYDADRVFISAVSSASKRLAATSIPAGAVYVRFGTHSTIPPASCIAVGLVKASKSNDEIIDIIRQALV